MKISPLSEAARFLNQVREKRDGQGGSHPQQHDQRKEERDGEGADQERLSAEKLSEAVASFGADAQAQQNGLSAAVEGAGPGLRVILRDVSGTVVRQLTGEEFVRLRQATGKAPGLRGKILDQKL